MSKYSIVFQMFIPGMGNHALCYVVSSSDIIEAIRKAQQKCGRTRFESINAYRVCEESFGDEEE